MIELHICTYIHTMHGNTSDIKIKDTENQKEEILMNMFLQLSMDSCLRLRNEE